MLRNYNFIKKEKTFEKQKLLRDNFSQISCIWPNLLNTGQLKKQTALKLETVESSTEIQRFISAQTSQDSKDKVLFLFTWRRTF